MEYKSVNFTIVTEDEKELTLNHNFDKGLATGEEMSIYQAITVQEIGRDDIHNALHMHMLCEMQARRLRGD